MNTQEKGYWEHRYDELFPNGLTQEQVDEANKVMWKGNTFYCGGCGCHIAILEYPHTCSNQGGQIHATNEASNCTGE